MMENIRDMGVLLGFYYYFCHAVRVCAYGYRGGEESDKAEIRTRLCC